MQNVIAEFNEGSHHCVSYRLYTATGEAVEPIVRIPLAVWLELNEKQQRTMVNHGLEFDAAHYVGLTPEDPTAKGKK